MSLYAKIRRMYFREHTPISEIARKTSLSRNTVKKWLKAPLRGELKYASRAGPSKLDPYAAELGRHWTPMRGAPSAIGARCWCCLARSRPRAIPAVTRA
jgi:transposase